MSHLIPCLITAGSKKTLATVLSAILLCLYPESQSFANQVNNKNNITAPTKPKEQHSKEQQSTDKQSRAHSSEQNKNPKDMGKTGNTSPAIDWGAWNSDPTNSQDSVSPKLKTSGVGIRGNIEAELSLIDKSNLLNNASAVATKPKNNNTGRQKKSRDLKKAMAELEAMEAKVKKEIEDDSEF